MTESYLTGASGFIGSKLRKALYARDSGVTSIPHDRIYGYQLEDFEKFFFLSTYGNMADHKDVSKILGANIADLQYVLDQILNQRFHPDLFVFLSSSSVNLKVQTFYSNTKKAAELMLTDIPIPTCIVRPYSVIGVNEQPQHLIPTLIRSCLEGEAMNFVPEATHDYVDIDDLIDGIMMLADKKTIGTFEFGSGVETTNQEVRELVEEGCGTKANVRIVESLRPYDNDSWYCERPAEGWKPKKSLRVSIAEMILEYKREHVRA